MQLNRFSRLGIITMIVGVSLFAGWLGIAARPSAKGTSTAEQDKRTVTPRPAPPKPPPPPPGAILPADVKPTCTVTAPVFASWFESGAVTLNGVVKPADSVAFPDIPNCSFYQWSEQMFLWLASPAPPKYGGGSRIFDSPVFYDVSPPDQQGNRTFIPHVPGKIRAFNVRAAQVGPNRLPVVFDKAGRFFEVEAPQVAPSGKPLIRNRAGKMVEIENVTVDKNRKPVFRDKAGKTIEPGPSQPPLLRQHGRETLTARKFTVGKTIIFLDPFGNVIDVEQGQAGGGDVLQAQNGSLVYYATMVNDVYAYFLTGAKNGGITPAPTQFPTTQAHLNKIIAFASAHGKTFPDPEALAVELKTSWVEATGLPNLGSYITMTATIPTYNKANPQKWTPNGQKTAKLALVGIHVVGSTKGHPEMIWATFEHFTAAPSGAYSYINTSNQTKTVAQNTAGTWLFTATNSAGPFNQAHMRVSGPDIVAVAPHTISPSDTIRWKAWGGASDFSPNPLDPTTAASNTEIIAINNSVLGKLVAGDVRGNYFMSGSTWTIGGAAPSGSFKPGGGGGNEVGTSKLANTTMETYQQGTNTLWATGSNCFSCHVTNQTFVSHIYPPLKPLF